MTVKEIIENYLKENGYEGLYNEDCDCECHVGYIMRECIYDCRECEAKRFESVV